MILITLDDNDGDIDVLELLLLLKLRLLIDTATLYILDPMSYYHYPQLPAMFFLPA